ncbi:PQQ-binding-like beta-propeller repeat protein [candidate division WOR-3 bacterium]|nr:PQQ-binding-like beta-propeller repeat protein [candidate division WOR-3 bacterium]
MKYACKLIVAMVGLLALASCTGPVGTIEVSSTPKGAEVFLDDTTTDNQTDCVLEDVDEGEHTIKLTLQGYADWDTTVTVEKNEVSTVDAVLSKSSGSIQVNSTPTGAAIALDGANTGFITNHELTGVAGGSRTVKLTLAGYQDWDTTVTVKEGQTTTVNATLSLPDSSLVWCYETEASVSSSPAIGDGAVYVGSSDNYLYAIDRADGSPLWRTQTDGEVTSSPAIDPSGIVYVGSMDGYLYCIDPDDGSVLWRYNTTAPVLSSPAIGSDGTIYVGSGTALLAINPNNTLKWAYPTNGVVFSSPAIDADGVIYFGSRDSSVYAVDASDGKPKWSHKTEGQINSSPAIGEDGTVYIASTNNELYALYPENGALKWSYTMDSLTASSAVVGADGTIYIGGWDGYLYAVNPSGILKWRYFTSIGGVNMSTPLVAADGTVYVGAYDGYLYAVNSSGEREWRYATNGPVRSSAVLYDGVIYVGSEDSYLYAIQASSYYDGPWPMFRHDYCHTGREDWNP